MDDDIKKEYIKTVLSLQEEDNRSVLLYVAFDLAVVSLTPSEKIFQGPDFISPLLILGLCLPLASAGLFFNYYRKMHLSRFRVAEALLRLDVVDAQRVPKEVWEKHRLGYRTGYALRLLGIAVLIAVLLAYK